MLIKKIALPAAGANPAAIALLTASRCWRNQQRTVHESKQSSTPLSFRADRADVY